MSGYQPTIAGGYMEVPEGPGLGVELDHQEARKYAVEGESYFE